MYLSPNSRYAYQPVLVKKDHGHEGHFTRWSIGRIRAFSPCGAREVRNGRVDTDVRIRSIPRFLQFHDLSCTGELLSRGHL
jgi:hypothetical protein